MNVGERAARAAELHRRAMIIDGLEISRWGDEQVYRHLHEGGLTGINASVAVWEGAKETLQNIGRMPARSGMPNVRKKTAHRCCR
jgi:hypothetical protein